MTYNQVIFVGTMERAPRVFTGERPLVSLFLTCLSFLKAFIGNPLRKTLFLPQ